MSRRRLAFASIAVVTVLCVVGVSILAVAAGGSALAYEVNGKRMSQQDFDQQLDDIVNTKTGAAQSHSNGTIDSTTSAQVLQSNIVLELLKTAAERKGVTVTQADRDKAKQQIGSQLDSAPESYRNLTIDIYAHLAALGVASSNAINALINREVKQADIYVNPRYGTWNPHFGVCPPTGCLTAGSGSSSSSGSASGG
jgi:SurA-like N-terminal domain